MQYGKPKSIFEDRDRLVREAAALRLRAQSVPSDDQRDDLLRQARRYEVAANIDRWADSSGLRPPK